MAVKKSASISKWVSVALVLSVLFYVGYQVYRSIYSTVKTELAVSHSVYESIETKGLIFRTETVIPPVSNGYLYYSVENGTRVAKDGKIASVYSTDKDGLLERQIAEIDSQIEAIKSISTDSSTNHVTLDIINTQTTDTVNELVMSNADGVFDYDSDAKMRLLSLLSKKKIITGESINFNDTLSQLESRKQKLKSQYHRAIASVKSPVSGYFADKTDGFETILSAVDPTKITVEKLNEYLSMDAPSATPSAGKIVSGYEWYLSCVVPESYYNTLAVGNTLSVRMSFVSDDEIPVTVAGCNKDNNGQLAVTFKCAYMSESLSTIRRETVQIQVVKHTGLRVPKRAIVIDDEMQAGVYVREGNVAAFRKIDQDFSEPADYVIVKETDDNGYLHLYDDIIVGGRNLYDGKIIR